MNTRFDAPHSRYNDVSVAQVEGAGLTVLAQNDLGEVHLAVSPDQIRVVYFQGHPEYEVVSLLKEYRREVRRYARANATTRSTRSAIFPRAPCPWWMR